LWTTILFSTVRTHFSVWQDNRKKEEKDENITNMWFEFPDLIKTKLPGFLKSLLLCFLIRMHRPHLKAFHHGTPIHTMSLVFWDTLPTISVGGNTPIFSPPSKLPVPKHFTRLSNITSTFSYLFETIMSKTATTAPNFLTPDLSNLLLVSDSSKPRLNIENLHVSNSFQKVIFSNRWLLRT